MTPKCLFLHYFWIFMCQIPLKVFKTFEWLQNISNFSHEEYENAVFCYDYHVFWRHQNTCFGHKCGIKVGQQHLEWPHDCKKRNKASANITQKHRIKRSTIQTWTIFNRPDFTTFCVSFLLVLLLSLFNLRFKLSNDWQQQPLQRTSLVDLVILCDQVKCHQGVDYLNLHSGRYDREQILKFTLVQI